MFVDENKVWDRLGWCFRRLGSVFREFGRVLSGNGVKIGEEIGAFF